MFVLESPDEIYRLDSQDSKEDEKPTTEF